MPTQLDNTWLPPETRTGWDGSDVWWPFDYGSWEYNRSRIGEKIFNGKEFDRVSWNYWGYEYSINIRILIEHYETWAKKSIEEPHETWAKKNIEEPQKITDGKNTITLDALLWYLRYEKKTMVAELLWENIAHYSWPIIKLPSKLHPLGEIGVISHTLMKAIKKSINELDIIK